MEVVDFSKELNTLTTRQLLSLRDLAVANTARLAEEYRHQIIYENEIHNILADRKDKGE
ncbi:hypothetical protein [Salmonella phage SSBI34]|nr:hypothetical protein [Salmonella phage SSBI34]